MRPPMYEEVLVSQLILMKDREWNHKKVVEFFLEDKDNILKIPIGGPNIKDEIIWHHNKNECYYVKSGYSHLTKAKDNHNIPSSSNDPRKFWKVAENAFLEQPNPTLNVNDDGASNMPRQPCWTALPDDWVKINCYVSVDKFSGCASAVAIIQDSSGSIIGGTSKICVSSTSDVADTLSIRMGIESARRLHLRYILIESNNKGLMERLQSKSFSSWPSDAVEKDIIDGVSVF
ncbi:hypothetical protein V6N13_106413 [Hibiscus sabdariffa]